MTWFHSFRADHDFTFYGDQPSPESLAKPLVAVVYVCVLLSGATLVATLGIRGKEKWSHAIRASYAVAIGSSILLCLMSHNWMEGSIQVKAPFVYRSNMHFSGGLSVQIGLKSANITLDGTYMSPSGGKNVYYVETLPWPKYGSERICYQHQLQRGLPGPILRVMDFLTYGHGDLQWGKSYHTAGQYAWGLLWTSFAFWLLSNLLLFSVVIYGAYMFFLTGVTLLMACVAYSQTLNPQPLHMTFGPDVLKLEYGWSFWLAIVAGSLTTVLGVLLIVTDYFLHPKVAEFFHLEKMGEEEDGSAKDDRSMSLNKNGLYQDARGLHGPGNREGRRGSIFLDPSRQTKWMMSTLGGPTKGNPFVSGVPNGNGHGPEAKVNPMYSEDGDSDEEMNRYGSNNPFRNNTRSKSESFISGNGIHRSSDRISNDRKPSLATLKEHRENHVNEQKIYSSRNNRSDSFSDSNSSAGVSNSLNNVNISNSNFTLQQKPQQNGARFIHEAARSIRERSSAPTVLQNGGGSVGRQTHTSDPENINSNETVVEVVVENPPSLRGREYDRGSGESVLSYQQSVEEEEEEEDGVSFHLNDSSSTVPNNRGCGLRKNSRGCDCASPLSADEGGCETASSSSCSDDAVFIPPSYSRSSSRQASEGEVGEEVTSHDVIPTTANQKPSNSTINKTMASDSERYVSIPIGEM